MIAWIARDRNYSLWIFQTKPKRYEDAFQTTSNIPAYSIEESWFKKEVTWENSPIKVKIEIQ